MTYITMINKTNNLTFTSRCPQVRDAQWVSHTVNTLYPHLSSTKFREPIKRIKFRNPGLYDSSVFGVPVAQKFLSDFEKKVLGIFKWRRTFVEKLNTARQIVKAKYNLELNRSAAVIEQLKTYKMGNCGEDAEMAATILRVNGVKNSYVASLSCNGKKVDHAVCVFNKDGSVFDGKISNKTMIIDPWLSEADFANNMFVKYKNLYKNVFNFPKISKIGIADDINSINLSGESALVLTLQDAKLLAPLRTREFMHK